MMTKKEIQEIIWGIADSLRSVIYGRDISFTVARILFLKYALDNFIGARTVSEMQQCAMAQKMFAMKDIESGPATIESVMAYIDNAFNFERILSSDANLQEYNSALFGLDHYNKKKAADADRFRRVLDLLGQLDLAEDEGSHELGRMMAAELIETIMDKGHRSITKGEVSTGHQLSELAGAILNVKKDDRYCDFASGIGVSTIDITRDIMPPIIATDINPSAVSVMAMLLIMNGYKDILLKVQDSIWQIDSDIHGNKIFTDIPVGMRNKDAANKYSDGTLAAIENTVNAYLDDKGVAVLTVPSGFLFKTDKSTKTLRKELIGRGLIKAVVSLPPMWMGKNMYTNLLVLSGESRYENILFIDASKRGIKERNGAESLSEKDLELIADTVNAPKTIEGFSYVSTSNEMIRDDYELLPAHYVTQIEEEESITMREIEEELKELYSRLSL